MEVLRRLGLSWRLLGEAVAEMGAPAASERPGQRYVVVADGGGAVGFEEGQQRWTTE